MRFTKLVSIGMIAGMAMALSGCFDSTPKCDDKEVKELVGKLAREAMIKTIDRQISAALNSGGGSMFDLGVSMGMANQLKQNKQDIQNATLELENFITESVNKDTKKATCKVNMTIKMEGREDEKGNVLYSVQNTDSKIYVEIQGFE